ncbi:MAG: PEP-CTERM sorting domain-containing protein [Nitrospirota bacterium]
MKNNIIRLPVMVASFFAVALFGFSGLAFAVPVIVDDFITSSATVIANSTTPSVSSSVSGAGILGGTRSSVLTYGSGPNDSRFLVAGGRLGYGEDVSTDGSLNLTYTLVGGFDLTDGGNHDRFIFDVHLLQHIFALDITILSAGGGSSSLTGGPQNLTPSLVPFSTSFLFTGFSGSALLTNATSLVVSLDVGVPDTANDLLLNSISIDGSHTPVPPVVPPVVATPEPVSLMLLGMGAVGLFGFRSLRRKEGLTGSLSV